jgi:hypothetical protein
VNPQHRLGDQPQVPLTAERRLVRLHTADWRGVGRVFKFAPHKN